MTAPVKPAEPPKAEPGKRPSEGSVGGAHATPEAGAADDDGERRHPPVAPVDESNPLRSLGKAVSDAVTGSESDASPRPKR